MAALKERGWSFLAGLIRDLLVGRYIGLNALATCLVGFWPVRRCSGFIETTSLYHVFTMVGTWVGRSLVLLGWPSLALQCSGISRCCSALS